ncbi:MAG: DegT/DnrJ/EryC1/StrS aminotransferase family protein [Candidatus Aminicenantales bacterium]
MRRKFLPFSPPFISNEEIKEVTDTLKSDWITTGPKVKRLEEDFLHFLGSSSALALNSCTGALHTALATLGVGREEEVITTTMTFASTVNVIEHVGARPVLVDVEADTLNINPEGVAAAITTKTKAIMPVHYAGHPADLDPIYDLARRHNLFVIEDAAHAFPAEYKGHKIGSGKNPVAFSFYATKNITTAEGGMLTGEEAFIERARIISLHGMSHDAWKRYDKGGSWYYEVIYPGFKYNMTDIQASIGLAQLKKVNSFQKRRREIVTAYNEAFKGQVALETPVVRPEVAHAWHLYVLRLNSNVLTIGRDQFIEELKIRNIGTSVHFIPIHLHPYYRDKYGYKPEDFPIAYSNYLRLLSLPLYPRMTDQDVTDVIEAVLDIIERYKR